MIRDVIENYDKFSGILPETKTKITSYGVTRKLKSGEVLFLEREKVDRVYFLLEGFISLYKVNKKYEKRVIYLIGQGEFLNEVILDDNTASVSCAALTEVKVLSIPKRQLLEMMEQDAIFEHILVKSMAKKIRRLYHQVGNAVNSMRLERQVASKLWKIGRDYGVRNQEGMIVVPFPMTITFLAEMLGSKRETISRIVKKLAEYDIVQFEKSICIIKDMDKLKNIVEKEDGA